MVYAYLVLAVGCFVLACVVFVKRCGKVSLTDNVARAIALLFVLVGYVAVFKQVLWPPTLLWIVPVVVLAGLVVYSVRAWKDGEGGLREFFQRNWHTAVVFALSLIVGWLLRLVQTRVRV